MFSLVSDMVSSIEDPDTPTLTVRQLCKFEGSVGRKTRQSTDVLQILYFAEAV